MPDNGAAAVQFEHLMISSGVVHRVCQSCGATVSDSFNAERGEGGLRPNQARHAAFHVRLGF